VLEKKMLERLKHTLTALRPGNGSSSDVHLGEPGFLRKVLRRKELESVFLFVTARCNSRCRTCFYSQEMASGVDMTFDEIRRVSETAPTFDKLWLSGGEPFLRSDLAEIVELFYRNNKIKAINMPTNGLLADPIERVVGRLLETCPDLTMHLNFSLDGLGPTHDLIRGVPGAFCTTVATIEHVEQRFGDNPRLLHNAVTVVTPDNQAELRELGAYVLQKFRMATHFFETMRGSPRDRSLERLGRAELSEVHGELLPLYRPMAERLFAKLPPGVRDFATLYFIGTIRFLYQLQADNVEGPRPWGMDCMAGQTTIVLDHNGAFRSCEMRPPIGRLQDYGFDLGAAFRSDAMRREVEEIGGGRRANCWCTHTCWTMCSLKFSPRTLLLDIPGAYLGYRLSGRRDLGLTVDVDAIDRRCASARSGAA
jgi:Fe-coproporphyrin III synthase